MAQSAGLVEAQGGHEHAKAALLQIHHSTCKAEHIFKVTEYIMVQVPALHASWQSCSYTCSALWRLGRF
jgi:hypothetical protein